MKALSASIIVTAGLLCFVFGANMNAFPNYFIVSMVGLAVTLAGMIGWFMNMRTGDTPKE